MKKPFALDGWGGIEFETTSISHGEVMDLIRTWTDGLCPICFEDINEGAVICDECLERAEAFRQNGPPVGL